MAFWDTSAVVPLCCWQPETAASRRLRREFQRMIVWWGTAVEARSALARLVREGHLTPAQRLRAVARLRQLRAAWDEILPTEKVRTLAEDLPDRHGVRAADALQLAAALIWCGERPRNRPFVCFDEDLAEAAEAAGFAVRRLPAARPPRHG
jgi:predicted nucleic acid-binding protein